MKCPRCTGTGCPVCGDSGSVFSHKGDLPWLEPRIILYHVHGSRAYGTHRPDSDYDFKGVTVPPAVYRGGYMHRFEQAEVREPMDAVVFSIQKFMDLASNCNPNIIEMAFVDEGDILVCTGIGRKILDAREQFLSKKALGSFRGYAMSQLARIKTHRRWILEPMTTPPERVDFGLKPLGTDIEKGQLLAAMSMVTKKMDSWAIDFEDLSEASKIYVFEQIRNYLAEVSIGSDEKFMAAGRLVGFSENFLELLDKEKRYKKARDNWTSYQDWKKNRNPARAELEAKWGMDCYFDDTEFLTPRGWFRYDEVRDDDELATLNQETGRIEYQFPTERVAKPYDGQIGVLHPRHSNCAVTMNHRMWVSPARRSAANGFSWGYKPEGAEWQIQKLGDLVGGRRSYFHIRVAGEPNSEDYPDAADEYLRLMGAYVSEGWVGKRLSDGTASVLCISQKDGGRLQPLMEDIERANPGKVRRFERLHDEEHRTEPCLEIVWTIADRNMASVMERGCGSGSLDKRLPFWTRSLSARQAGILLNAMVCGDGTHRPFSDVYYTSSKRLAGDIQAMCVHAGIISQVWGPYPDKRYPSRNPMYQVYLGRGLPVQTVSLKDEGSQNFDIEEVRGARIVCFTVPNEVLVTRRSGKVAIQGNTKHAMHLVRLMRMCREILTEGVVRVKRPDAAELLSIRDGAWTYDKLMEWAVAQNTEMVDIARTSKLPKHASRKALDKLCRELVAEASEEDTWDSWEL